MGVKLFILLGVLCFLSLTYVICNVILSTYFVSRKEYDILKQKLDEKTKNGENV